MSGNDDGVKKAFDYLNGKTFFVATVDGDKARVRPFGFVALIEGKIYFANNELKPSYRQITANPNIEISAVSEDGSTWIRVSATAVYDIRQEIEDAAFETTPQLKENYHYGTPNAPKFTPFYLKDAEATIYSHTMDSETFTF